MKSLSGKKKVHIQYPLVHNRITICRRCEKFEDSSEEEFNKNPCKICLKNSKWYKVILEREEHTRDIWYA